MSVEQKKKEEQQKKRTVDEVLSEEDQLMKQRIDDCVAILLDENSSVSEISKSIELLKKEVKEATTTMTSVPKPFKFLKEYYSKLVDYYQDYKDKQKNKQVQQKLADIMSILAVSFSDIKQQSLKYLLESTKDELTEWGYGYMSHLSGEIAVDYQLRLQKQENTSELIELVNRLTPKLIETNAESEAIDLLLEVDQLQNIKQYVNINNYSKISHYLQCCSQYNSDQQEMYKILTINFECLFQLEQYNQALRMAIKINDNEKIKLIITTLAHKTILNSQYKLILTQVTYDLTRIRNASTIILSLEIDEDLKSYLMEIVTNKSISLFYKQLAKDLDVLEPKSPLQVYKEENDKSIDSAKINLANTYVNAFVNLGMGNDTLMINRDISKDGPWIYKLKNDGLIAGSASIGMICMWDFELGNEHIAEYLDLKEGYAQIGSYIGVGLYSQNLYDENDTLKAILEEKLLDNTIQQDSKVGALMGLALGYAGTEREEFIQNIIPFIIDTNYKVEVNAMASLMLALNFVSTRNEEVANAVLQNLMEKDHNNSWGRMLSLSLGLLFMGQQDKVEPTIEASSLIFNPNLANFTSILIRGCAYVDSGNPLQIQHFMHIITKNMETLHSNENLKKELEKEELEEEQNKDETNLSQEDRKLKQESRQKKKQKILDDSKRIEEEQLGCIISICLIASSEQIGNDMIVRQLNHLYQMSDLETRRGIPIGLALLHISNPKISIMDSLNKMSHDQDTVLSQRAIVGLGLIGLGTNNSRLANILRNISWYYGHDSNFVNHYFLTKISQGLLHSAKGLVTAQFYYSDRFLLDKVSLSAILIFIIAISDIDFFIHSKYHFLIYFLALAIKPRYIITLDTEQQHKPVQIRVGQALDYVAQAGKPKKITGFQTHTSPVILSNDQRAELASDEFIPVADVILENVIILKKNEEFIEEEKK